MNKGKNSCRRLAKHHDVEGHAHFPTFSCWKRQAFLSRDRTRTWFLENRQVARRLFDLREKVEYIHANPIRRKLVDRPEDWAWSSYRAWETGEDVPMALDRESYPVIIT